MKNVFKLTTILVFIFIGGCKKESPTEQKNILIDGGSIAIPIVYMNSFESVDDTFGWKGLYQYMIVDGAAPNCGYKSLKIGGGCIFPTATIDFDSTLSGHSYKLSFWGKVGKNGGMLFLTTNDDESFSVPAIFITEKDTAWTFFNSDSSFYCPSNKRLRLGIFSGGDNPSHIYVDRIAIVQTD